MRLGSYEYCTSGGPGRADPRIGGHGSGKHHLALPVLAILTAAAIGGIVVWYYLSSWISLPLL